MRIGQNYKGSFIWYIHEVFGKTSTSYPLITYVYIRTKWMTGKKRRPMLSKSYNIMSVLNIWFSINAFSSIKPVLLKLFVASILSFGYFFACSSTIITWQLVSFRKVKPTCFFETLVQMFSYEFCEMNFQNTFFYRTSLMNTIDSPTVFNDRRFFPFASTGFYRKLFVIVLYWNNYRKLSAYFGKLSSWFEFLVQWVT